MRFVIAATALLISSGAQAMSVADFLTKADALKAKGIFAMMSSDIGLLKAEIGGAGKAYRADLNARKVAGQPAPSCPPPKVSMDSDQLIAYFRSIPATQRPTTSVNTAFAGMMAQRFPCKK
jgi:hypothetical protein